MSVLINNKISYIIKEDFQFSGVLGFWGFEFGAIVKHIKVNRQVYGNNISFFKEVVIGFLTAPFRLIKNLIRKRIG